ncbi:hypothetical protein [Algibacter sp.]|uniref:hypothetical protein n=1 Tax=Algibacter sp. TaxID=1872428 RepID=UPI003C766AB7
MVGKLKAYILIIFPFWILIQNGTDIFNKELIKIQHTVHVKHPGEKNPVEIILNEIQDEKGLSTKYYANVESVICYKEVCKVVSVRIYWNNIGEYQKYELGEGVTLEKYEAELFDAQDYKKLHTVIADKKSPYKDLFVDDILSVVNTEGNGDLDAVSGATAVKLDDKDTVPGAALTCFTLWHWANGNIIPIIKKITGKSASNKQLTHFLKDENKAYYFIAIDELINRNNYTSTLVDIIINEAIQNEHLIKPSISYLESSPPNIYFPSVKTIFGGANEDQKLASIKSLQNIKHEIPKGYLDDLSNEINNLKSFQETTRFIDLLETKTSASNIVIENLLPLLDGDFLKARRVYWYLSNEKLSVEQKNRVDSFFEKHKNQL